MKTLLTITLVLVFSVICLAQSPQAADTPKPVASPAAIKMPAVDSAELANLQQQANSVTAQNKDVIAAFKQYEAQMSTLNSRAAVLIARAALKAKMTIEQLDSSDLVWDEKVKAYEWRPRSTPVKQGN